MTYTKNTNKIKVMHILHNLGIGGMETVLIEMLQLFDKDRFTTYVCSLGSRRDLVPDLEKAGIEVFTMAKNSKFDICRIFKLARLLKDKKIDIVHSYSGVYRDDVIAAKLAGVPVILHTDQGKFYPDKMSTKFYHRFFTNYFRNRITAVSEDLKSYFSKDIKINPEKIVVIPNGVRLDRVKDRSDRSAYRRKIGLSEKDLAIGIIARLAPVKDHKTLIEACYKVFKELPNAKLLIVGNGPLKEELEAKVKSLNINSKVIFMGQRRDIPEILSALDIFVLSSKHEGISLSILEAMAHGLPVVATNVGGNPDLVEDDKTGYLVLPGDPEALASAIVNILTDKNKRIEFGKNGRLKVEEKFDLTKIVRQYEGLYNSYFPKGGKRTKVMYLASNPEWAGAEVHLATLADSLKSDERVDVSVCVFHDGKLVNCLKRHGIKVSVLSLKRLFDISSIFKVGRMLKEKDVDILHTHGYKANFIGAIASLFHKKTKCVRTEHGLTEPFCGFDKVKMNFYEGLDYLAGRFLTKKIISVSHDIKNHIEDRFPNKIFTVHNGIGTTEDNRIDSLKIKESLGLPKESFVIGIVGRLVPVKGHKYFIDAAKMILEHRKDARFLVVGDGPLRKDLESSVPENLLRNIIFTGFRDDVKNIIGIMDIVVFSSLSEGIPYTLLEVMALGKAVVATRVGGLVEVISDGKNGLLVKSQDKQDMAEKCLYLLENKKVMQAIGEEAMKTIKDNFSIDKMKEETIRVYEEVLA